MVISLLALADRLRDAGRRRHMDPDLALGRRAEDLAHRYIQRLGYRVVARNWRSTTPSGEIDIMAWAGDALVVVEVKARLNEERGSPERQVDEAKRDSLRRTGYQYARTAGVDPDLLRFDLITVVFEPELEIRHYPAAFSRRR